MILDVLINKKLPQGQALVMLLMFMAIAVIVTAGGVSLTIISSLSTSKFSSSELAYHYAEAGAEEAILSIIRDPSYTINNKSLTIGDGNVKITVSGTTTKTITAISTNGLHSRSLQVQGSYLNNVFTINSWQEIN